jgi:hypothetical protein
MNAESKRTSGPVHSFALLFGVPVAVEYIFRLLKCCEPGGICFAA